MGYKMNPNRRPLLQDFEPGAIHATRMEGEKPMLNDNNTDQFTESYLYSQRSIPPDPTQERLTTSYIIPHLASILLDFVQLREAIDLAANTFSLHRHGAPLNNIHAPSGDATPVFYSPMLQSAVEPFLEKLSRGGLADYPIGRCSTITHIAWHLLKNEDSLPQTEGFSRLRTFIDRGGIFQAIWGGLQKKYFQTAFQAGNYYFDISNDTVDLYKSKIDHAFLAESQFHDICSYREYTEIKADYHQMTPFINNCFPRLFPYFPLLVRPKAGGPPAIDTIMHMARLNIATRFYSILDALDAGVLGNPLDAKSLQQIHSFAKAMEGGRGDLDWLTFRMMGEAEMVRLLREAADLDRPEHVTRLKRAEKICRFLNHVWAK